MKLLFIGARLFEDVALYTKRMGITSLLTESNPKSPNIDLADSYHLVSRGMEGPKELAIKEDVDGVVPLIGVDNPLIDVALLKEELEKDYGMPVVSSPLTAASISGNKVKTKKFFLKNNIKTPEYQLISSDQKVHLDFPVVLKQAHGQGGYNIKIALSQREVDDYMEIFDETLAESFLEGVEISVEILRWNGHTVPLVPVYKGKTTLKGTHPLKKLRKAPLEINGVDNKYNNQQIRYIAQKIGECLGVEGCADLDLIFDSKKKQNYMLEINTRPSGTRYLTAAASGINPLQEMVDMAADRWRASKLRKRIKEHFSLEIPVGEYPTDRNNYKFREFNPNNCWIIHGPQNSQRITIRGKNQTDAFKTAKKLNLDLSTLV
ncbi:MAG: ATP-grasp domain-containing protein [Methanobacteriaceae archaeon]